MVSLGTNVGTGKSVELSEDARRQGLYVPGIAGSGKTNLLGNMIHQDAEAGHGLCVIDPHGDLVLDLLHELSPKRAKDVILFNPADMAFPFALNFFEVKDASDHLETDRVCEEIITTLRKVSGDFWGPRMDDIQRHAIKALFATPGCTLLDMLPFLTQEEKRREYLARVTDPVILDYWEYVFPKSAGSRNEWISSTMNRLGRFLTNPVIRNIVSQPKSTFNLRTIMDEGKILLVNLSKGLLGEDNSALLGSILTSKLLIAAFSRTDTPYEERVPFRLYVDEFARFATDSFPSFLEEARKFAISTTLAHQHRLQLNELNRGATLSVGNFVFFRLTGLDAREVALQFDNTPPVPDPRAQAMLHPTGTPGVFRSGNQVLVPGDSRPYGDVERETANALVNNPNYHAYCKLIEGDEIREYHIRTDYAQRARNEAQAEAIVRQSQALARPVAEVEQRVAERLSQTLPRSYN